MNKLEILSSLAVASHIIERMPHHIPYMLTVQDNLEISLDIAPSSTLDFFVVADILNVTSSLETDEIQVHLGALTVTTYLETSVSPPLPFSTLEVVASEAAPPISSIESCPRCLRRKEQTRNWARTNRNTGRPAGRPGWLGRP